MRRQAKRVPEPPHPRPASTPPWRRAGTALLAAALAAVLTAELAGCGAGAGSGGAGSGGAAGGAAAEGRGRESPPGFPVKVTNCGVTTTYKRPPQRVVTMNQDATEIMLALGLEDRMVGTAFLDNRILPKYREAYRKIPVLAEQYPSYEVLLKAAPDFVYGGFASAFSQQEGRSRQRLRAAGIETHLNPQDCTARPTGMPQLWRELRTVATIFGVEQRAQTLIGRMKADLAATRRKLDGVDPVSVFVYDSGTKAPMTAGGHGIGNEIIRLAGGRNVFASADDEFFDASWEQVVKRRPESVVILDYGDTTAGQKERFLLGNAVLAGVPAVKQRRFAVLPLSATVLGVRAPRAVAELARQLHPKRFP